MQQTTSTNGNGGNGSAPLLGRVPPHDLDAETSVLGAILLSPAALPQVLDELTPEDFYRENNGAIYRAALGLFGEGEPIDNVTLAAELEKRGLLERVGGRAHLALLQESVPTAANVEHYARIVRGKADKRRLIDAGAASQGFGFDDSLEPDEAINQAQAAMFALSGDRAGQGLVRAGSLVQAAMASIDNPGTVQQGLKMGLTDLDRRTGGLRRGELVVLAARPSMGKSALAFQVAAQVAVDQKRPVAIYSLEMSKEQVIERLLCMRAHVDSYRFRRAQEGELQLSDHEYDSLASATGPLGDAPLFIDDSPTLADLAFRMKARQASARESIELFVVDFLQLMDGKAGGGGGDNRVQEVSAISRALKAVARELGVPVLAVSQLSRACESRTDKRPMLSDLRESGEIEQCADLVLLLYRDDYYNRDRSEKPGVAEVNVGKHRNGPTGVVELRWDGPTTTFRDLERRLQVVNPDALGPDE
ncbi:MAG TPA: replicative DNA helicase [Candidatus Dormibacteraeota bacterium]